MEKEIVLKSVGELLGLKFLIPSYQRGYRWDKKHVIDLLNDIWDFHKSQKNRGEFYCLQPIIIKKKNDTYLVIDGQQRLTTIYLILSYLKLYMKKKENFKIVYETREKSHIFLDQIDQIDQINDDNIDTYYISQAFLVIKEWFEKYENDRDIDFFNILVKKEIEKEVDVANNVRFIWYEIDEKENEINVFTRINSGKIPLTNAELIKALFLNSKNFKENNKNIKQIEISKEWDEIEYFLQNDEFWYFLTKDKSYSTRIEIIFEILLNHVKNSNDEYFIYRTFLKFIEKDKNSSLIERWSDSKENIKKVFLNLRHWFNDRELYHLVGFLVSTKTNIIEIYHDSKEKTKTEFRKYLKEKIREKLKLDKYILQDLKYGDDNEKILQVLLLFNIETLLKENVYFRFAFDKFNNEKWTLEHVHAQQENKDLSKKEIQIWLKNIKESIYLIPENKEKDLISMEIKSFLSLDENNIIKEKFIPLQEKIFDLFGGNKVTVDSIGNLALLSSTTNSSIGNKVFPEKRISIIEKDKKGEFIPICTKNVFLKYYSSTLENLYFWSGNDQKDYLQEMISVLGDFLRLGDTNE